MFFLIAAGVAYHWTKRRVSIGKSGMSEISGLAEVVVMWAMGKIVVEKVKGNNGSMMTKLYLCIKKATICIFFLAAM